MIESLACGTPIIACQNGSVPEVLEQGVTGFIVKDVDSAVDAVKNIPRISRRRCREVFEKRFTARKMAENYLAIYRQLVAAQK
jgi:glycosyltransferase involved in cell wall biosynthesis